MSTTSSNSFYLFKGNGQQKFLELNNAVEPNNHRQIAIWTPKDKSKKHSLIVVGGDEFPQHYCLDKSIWKTDENVFEFFFKQKINNYSILTA